MDCARHDGVARVLPSDAAVVDCWIGVAQENDQRVVRLAGRLAEAQVPELLQACAGSHALQLDLTDLVSADAAGLEALQRVRARGAMLIGVPGYIQLKLDSTVQGSRP
jgi:ABC-type transporter Mla MlaB component